MHNFWHYLTFNFSGFNFSFFTLETFRAYILSGLAFSVLLTVVATLLGLFFGVALALMRLSSFKLLSWILPLSIPPPCYPAP